MLVALGERAQLHTAHARHAQLAAEWFTRAGRTELFGYTGTN